MKVFRALSCVVACTIVALFYVHQQVEAVKMNYIVRTQEESVLVLLDQREKLVYNLNHLSSPSRLEDVLVAKNVQVRYPGKEQVIRVAAARSASKGPLQLARSSKKGAFDHILELVGMGREAQAKER